MQKKSLVISIIIMAIETMAFARQQPPSDMRDSADMRDQVQETAQAATSVTGRNIMSDSFPASTPEKEMERRRRLINNAHRDFMNIKADTRSPVGSSQNPVTLPERTGADAQGQLNNEVLASSPNSLRNLPEPPRAVPVEGRIVIEGGQADARAPRDQNVGIKYSIEERFVGNLVISSTEPEIDTDIETRVMEGKLTSDEKASASGKGYVELSASGSRGANGVLSSDYQIDTISTGVKVISLGGGACIRSDGGRDPRCVEQDPFTKIKVSEENKYGKFNDGVVAAQREGNKIKIEVSSPEVSFSSAMDKGKTSVGCSEAVFEINTSEFKQMVDSGSMTLTKQVGDANRASSGCRPGSTITLYMNVKGK